jgi:DNA-binding CsgD family transcriptional regulator/tetratricopeptide (TPR) repeat protein
MIVAMSQLLERDGATDLLHEQLARAKSGHGGVAVIAGEAGIGKTTLVQAFLECSTGIARTLVGVCDPLETPRPLGPLIDAALPVAPDLARRVAAGLPRASAFASALDLIDDADGPVVFVIEDLHWADEATLDLFTFIARRLDERPALLIVTFRSDEVDDRHPLRLRLGDVRAHIRTRIELDPLSTEAVRSLADGLGLSEIDVDIDALHRTTRGNPFFVTEVLAARTLVEDGASEVPVPQTVREAVMARAGRLRPSARHVLDAISIVPGSAPRWLVNAISDLPDDEFDDGLDTCIGLGLLRSRPDGAIEFRHELGRLTIERSLGARRSHEFHARALSALRSSEQTADRSRLAHHASGADDGASVVELAPVAAAEAMVAGSYREACVLLEMALRHAHVCDAAQRGTLWLRLGSARCELGELGAGLDAFTQAAAEFRAAGDDQLLAEAYVECAGASGSLGQHAERHRYLHQAETLLDLDIGPSRGAALLAAEWCTEHMLTRSPALAEEYGQRAMALATQIGDIELYARVAIQSGISLCMAGDHTGLQRVRRGMTIGEQLGADDLVAHGFSQIGSGYGELRRYDIALAELRLGIEYTSARELVARKMYMSAWLARCELETGDWNAAGRRASQLAAQPRNVGLSRFVTMVTLGWLRMRRGDPGVTDALDEILAFARSAGHLQRLWPAAACAAEYAWMQDRLPDALEVLHQALEVAERLEYAPAIEELGHWLVIAGDAPTFDASSATTPFGLSAAGRPDLAVTAWDERGCPYEAALARVHAGGADNLRSAFVAFDALGAAPMRDRAGRLLRAQGARVPRGPHRSTQGNPHGLTDRELDVLRLLPTGSTNSEIGKTLYISERTVSHHVSRILSKLAVSTRAEAAIEAHRLDLTE